jgi:hypothetical protein
LLSLSLRIPVLLEWTPIGIYSLQLVEVAYNVELVPSLTVSR